MIKLLDCTLRDGGYINNWDFGEGSIKGIFGGLVSAGLDYIELGFIEDDAQLDANRTIFPPEGPSKSTLDEWVEESNSQSAMWNDIKPGCKVVGMMDYGKSSIENVPKVCDSSFDAIRIMFKKPLMEEAIDFGASLIELGYEVLLQPVSITSYRAEELNGLLGLTNKARPHGIYIVDTYGFLSGPELLKYAELMDQTLDPGIAIGYHGHNNLQQGYGNITALIEWHNGKTKEAGRPGLESAKQGDEIIEFDRTMILDGSLYGMGKTAGNPPTELVAGYINGIEASNSAREYDMHILVDTIEEYILPLRGEVAWGYDLYNFIAAYTKCHPKYIAEMRKAGLRAGEILNKALRIPEEDKLN